ncbi:hypothetical protein EDC14_100188 [Hydrogenispora ethanolica]|uniref:Uncharacterized protein n=1 Tax=Hydrogenispora ethanolica TaxID=1082276 RepID=A0A4R1SB86_HYDET|nr:hypothetical protein [Hydrogenispora ethanolica]TCL76806.1 hypothetical protein EDC14_100188 [Hydrogenispora ethanolica]
MSNISFSKKYPYDGMNEEYYLIVQENADSVIFELCQKSALACDFNNSRFEGVFQGKDSMEKEQFALEKVLSDKQVVSQLTINLQELFQSMTTFCIYKNIKKELVPPIRASVSRDSDTMERSNYRISDGEVPLAYLYFHEQPSEYLIICHIPVVPENYDQERSHFNAVSEYIMEKFPDYKGKLNIIDAKRKLLCEIDPNESLSAIEAQLDLLSLMVFRIIETIPEPKKYFADFEDFRKTFDQTSVLTVKSMDKCLKEMTGIKKLIRTLQEEYYEKKDKL